MGSGVEQAGCLEVGEDQVVDGGDPGRVGGRELDEFGDLAGWGERAGVLGGVARHADDDAVHMAMGRGFEGAEVYCGRRVELDGQASSIQATLSILTPSSHRAGKVEPADGRRRRTGVRVVNRNTGE